jgi:hypothetical protein
MSLPISLDVFVELARTNERGRDDSGVGRQRQPCESVRHARHRNELSSRDEFRVNYIIQQLQSPANKGRVNTTQFMARRFREIF